MSALDNMLADMLKKALPPEVMEMLAPEKINEFGEKINAFIVDIRQGQQAINERLDKIETILERFENEQDNNSSSKRGKSAGIGNGNGSATGND